MSSKEGSKPFQTRWSVASWIRGKSAGSVSSPETKFVFYRRHSKFLRASGRSSVTSAPVRNTLVRTKRKVRAPVKIGLMNLPYNV